MQCYKRIISSERLKMSTNNMTCYNKYDQTNNLDSFLLLYINHQQRNMYSICTAPCQQQTALSADQRYQSLSNDVLVCKNVAIPHLCSDQVYQMRNSHQRPESSTKNVGRHRTGHHFWSTNSNVLISWQIRHLPAVWWCFAVVNYPFHLKCFH